MKGARTHRELHGELQASTAPTHLDGEVAPVAPPSHATPPSSFLEPRSSDKHSSCRLPRFSLSSPASATRAHPAQRSPKLTSGTHGTGGGAGATTVSSTPAAAAAAARVRTTRAPTPTRAAEPMYRPFKTPVPQVVRLRRRCSLRPVSSRSSSPNDGPDLQDAARGLRLQGRRHAYWAANTRVRRRARRLQQAVESPRCRPARRRLDRSRRGSRTRINSDDPGGRGDGTTVYGTTYPRP